LDHFTPEQASILKRLGILTKLINQSIILGNAKVIKLLKESNDIEEKYSHARHARKDDWNSEDDELVSLLVNLINQVDVSMEELIGEKKYDSVALCLLWGHLIRFEHLKALLRQSPVQLSLVLYMLKRNPPLAEEERKELRELAKKQDLDLVQELLEGEEESSDEEQQLNFQHASPSKSKRKALKEGLKHQLSKIAPS
jgi:succinate dehydrogenase flavin-adding protein (antitoxin of CptAB toxin-antitoxin module)